jgi:hypothetical protein
MYLVIWCHAGPAYRSNTQVVEKSYPSQEIRKESSGREGIRVWRGGKQHQPAKEKVKETCKETEDDNLVLVSEAQKHQAMREMWKHQPPTQHKEIVPKASRVCEKEAKAEAVC